MLLQRTVEAEKAQFYKKFAFCNKCNMQALVAAEAILQQYISNLQAIVQQHAAIWYNILSDLNNAKGEANRKINKLRKSVTDDGRDKLVRVFKSSSHLVVKLSPKSTIILFKITGRLVWYFSFCIKLYKLKLIKVINVNH